jgi:tetratricopeptide (TPR) repeat protein
VRRYRLFLLLAAVFAAKLIVLLQLRDHPLLQADPNLVSEGSIYGRFLSLMLPAAHTFTTARVIQIVFGTTAVGCVFVAARTWFGERAAWLAAIAAGLTGVFTFYELLIAPSALNTLFTAAALMCLALAFSDRPDPVSRLTQGTREASIAWGCTAGVLLIALAWNTSWQITDPYFSSLGWTWIRAAPGDAARLVARQLALAFSAAPIASGVSYSFFALDSETLLSALRVGPWLLWPLGVAGLAAAAWRHRRRGYLAWCAFVPVYAVAIAVFTVNDETRLPLLVALAIGTGAAVDRFISRGALMPRIAVPVIAVAVALVVNRPVIADDGRAETRTRMAEAMITRDEIDAAEAWTKQAVAIHPRPALVHFRVGRLLIVHSRPDAAIVHLRRSLELEPAQAEAEYALGQALVDARQPAEAIPHLQSALKAGVRVNLAGFDLARAFAATGDRGAALQVLQGVRPELETDYQGWDALGQLAMRLESPSLAAAFFNDAIKASPRTSKPRQDMGLALAMMGRYQEAIAHFEQGVALDPADPAAHLNLAVAYAETGRKADARGQAEEALRLRPGYQRAQQFLAALR